MRGGLIGCDRVGDRGVSGLERGEGVIECAGESSPRRGVDR